MNFEQSLKRLDEIVRRLESSDISLEESIELYGEGTALLGSCRKQLEEAEMLVAVAEQSEED